MLRNGARFYNDHAHPEYCTPECSRLLEFAAGLRGGFGADRVREGAQQNSDNPVLLYKNNTDFRGHSYGCHENYLMPRTLTWDTLSQAIVAFL